MFRFSGEKIRRGKGKVGESPTRDARGSTNLGSKRKTKIKGWRENSRSCRKVSLLYDVEIRVKMYRISSYSFRGNSSFLNFEIQRLQYIRPKGTIHKGAETIQGRKLFKGGNYSRKYGKYKLWTLLKFWMSPKIMLNCDQ